MLVPYASSSHDPLPRGAAAVSGNMNCESLKGMGPGLCSALREVSDGDAGMYPFCRKAVNPALPPHD